MTHTNNTTTAIVDFLNLKGHFVWRNNTTGIYDPIKKVFRKNKNAKNGVSDVLGVLKSGTFIAVEVKTGNDILSEDQIEFLAEVIARNGVAMVVKTFDDFIKEYSQVEKQNLYIMDSHSFKHLLPIRNQLKEIVLRKRKDKHLFSRVLELLDK